MFRRPRIAVPARFSESASALRHRADVGSRNLLAAVYAAGGDPLLMHPYAPDGVADPEEVAARLDWADGVLLPGGGDLAGRWSGQPEHPTLYDVDLEQDAFDLEVARHALAVGLPTLAVCRGLQVVNVLRGGTLIQDMDSHDSTLGHHRHRSHVIGVDPDTSLAAVAGERLGVSCYHHQCLGTLGAGMRAVARSEDGVIEGVQIDDLPGWFLGVQWHPEDTWAEDPVQLRVFAEFVAACRTAGQARSSTVVTI